MDETNWAGNHRYRAHTLHRPTSMDALQEVVAQARSLRVLGTRHSFTDLADADELVTLDGLPAEVVVDHTAGTVTASAWLRYGDLAAALRSEGVGLANLASLQHVSLAGAVTTATHGSGDDLGNLATQVVGIELVDGAGELRRIRRGETDFDGVVVGLGAAGVVTRLTLAVEPAYDVVRHTFEGVAFDALVEALDDVFAAGYSVSVLTDFGPRVERIWVNHRCDGAVPAHPELLGVGVAADTDDAVSAARARPGSWADRLAHFTLDDTPSVGDELQAGYAVPRHHAVAALRALQQLAPVVQPVLHVSELRTVAADQLWMSPQHGRDTLSIGLTLRPEPGPVADALFAVEAALAPLGARPHWGKLFHHRAEEIAGLYERHDDFLALLRRLDPDGTFRNAWLRERVEGSATR